MPIIICYWHVKSSGWWFWCMWLDVVWIELWLMLALASTVIDTTVIARGRVLVIAAILIRHLTWQNLIELRTVIVCFITILITQKACTKWDWVIFVAKENVLYLLNMLWVLYLLLIQNIRHILSIDLFIHYLWMTITLSPGACLLDISGIHNEPLVVRIFFWDLIFYINWLTWFKWLPKKYENDEHLCLRWTKATEEDHYFV